MKPRYEDPKWAVVVYAPDWEDDLAVETPNAEFNHYISGKALYYISGKALYEWLKGIYEEKQKE